MYKQLKQIIVQIVDNYMGGKLNNKIKQLYHPIINTYATSNLLVPKMFMQENKKNV